MATNAPTTKEPKAKKAPVDLVTRLKTQLTTAALRAKIKPEELDALRDHIEKLKTIL